MKKALLILAIIFCSAQLYSAEPLVKFYLQDGSAKQYNISEIQNFKFINSNLSYRMETWVHGSIYYGDNREIDSVYFENNKMITAIGNNFAMLNLWEIDSITFIWNICQEIQIGSQVWMCRNLDVDHYRNGDSIPEVRDSAEWANLKTGAWCYYNNDPSLGAIYGKLYNWYAVNDSRGLAPDGWHVPSDFEWTLLRTYLGGIYLAGGKLKSTGTKEAGDGLWSSPNNGATNESGFSAHPGGRRNDVGLFSIIGYNGYWWSATESHSCCALYRNLTWQSEYIYDYVGTKNFGYSVRCMRDN